MSQSDPRFKNQVFDASSPAAYLKNYADAIHHALSRIDAAALDGATEALKGAVSQGCRIYVAGNGGSAAISDHLCCDWTKGTRVHGLPTLKTHSLVSNVALLTAIANDYGLEDCFSSQLEMFAQKGDIVVLISSSGNSPNILKAAESAKSLGLKTIGFTGFSGGKLGAMVDLHLHADFANYGVVEDCHQVLMHVLAQFLAYWRDRVK